MLNMLIAMMGNTFSTVYDGADGLVAHTRAAVYNTRVGVVIGAAVVVIVIVGGGGIQVVLVVVVE